MTAYILKYALKTGVMLVDDAIEFGDGYMVRAGRTFPIYKSWQWAKTEEEARRKFDLIKERLLHKALLDVDRLEAAQFRVERG